MKRLLIILLLLASYAAAQTTTFTGTIKDLSGLNVTSGKLVFHLKPSTDTTRAGTARFVPTAITCKIISTGALKADDGVSSCVLQNNTSIEPKGTGYLIEECPYNACTAQFFTYAIGGTVDISSVVPTPVGSAQYSVVNTVSDQTIQGLKTFSDPTTVKTLNSMPFADQFGSIAAACTSLSGANGTVIISAASTVSINTTIPGNCNLEFKGGGLVTVSGGSTLTINSKIKAPISQIFSGAVAGLTETRPEWFGPTATVKNAVDACATTGCDVYYQNASYRSGYEKISPSDYSNIVRLTTPNVFFHGAGRPQYKSDYTQFVPGTGTIIYPSLYIRASGFRAEHLGVDSGSVVQTAYIPAFTANDSFVVSGALPNDATLYPALTGIVLNDVNCLGKATNTADHCLLVENVDHATVTNTESVYHTHCAVLKGAHSQWSGGYYRGCATDTMIVKGDTYALNTDNNVSNLTLSYLTTRKDSGGLAITSGSDNLSHLNVSNVTGVGLNFGIQIQPQGTGKVVTDVNVSNVVLDGNALPLVGDTDSCLSDTGVNASSRVRFSNITCNNAAYGGSFSAFANNYSINDAKFTFMYQQGIFSLSPSLQLNDISINTNAGAFTTYGIHVNGAGATTMVGNTYFLGNAITANFLADGGGAFVAPTYPGPLTVTGLSTLVGGAKVGASGPTWTDGRELIQSAHDCGTTTTCANTANAAMRMVTGRVTLTAGAATVASMTTFTSTSTFNCWATDVTTATNLANAKPASATSITVTGTGTDVISYGCIGN